MRKQMRFWGLLSPNNDKNDRLFFYGVKGT